MTDVDEERDEDLGPSPGDLLTRAVSALHTPTESVSGQRTYARRPQRRQSLQRPTLGPLFPEGVTPTIEHLETLRTWKREVELELEALNNKDVDGSETEGSETDEYSPVGFDAGEMNVTDGASIIEKDRVKGSSLKRSAPPDNPMEKTLNQKEAALKKGRVVSEKDTNCPQPPSTEDTPLVKVSTSETLESSISTPSPTPTWTFLMTGLSEKQVTMVRRAVSNLHTHVIPGPSDSPVPIKIKMTKDFSPLVTHLLTSPSDRSSTQGHKVCRRTAKYLSCLAAGRWIVDVAWVEESLKSGHWTLPDPYEMDGDDKSSPPRQAPRLSRLTPAPAPRLLSGHVFYLDPSLSPSLLPFYTQVIQLAGGRVTQVQAMATTLLATVTSSLSSNARVVSPDWLLDSLSRWKEHDS
ncbi:MAG: hypothetical protein DHS80DRAFT_24493 [Piptocephalis tieghemiana]|nr:MAG: hypothetical protein DHS80DRAFT_24493 [Piptocephalis tieghemiana]